MGRILTAILLLFTFSAHAQNTMYFMERMPQSNNINPAVIPDMKFHIGLPVLNTLAFEAYNSRFNYGELDDFMDNLGTENYNPDEFINSIKGNNKFLSEARINLLSIGFRLKEKGYFSFDLTANNILVNEAQPEVVYLLADNEDIPKENFPVIINNLQMTESNFISMGFSYSRIINERLTLGIRPVVNFNTFGLKTSGINYKITRDEVFYSEEFGDETYQYSEVDYSKSFAGNVTLGMPVPINPDAISGNELDLDEDLFPENWEEEVGFSDLLKNSSLTFDLGATYQLKDWTFSASLLNIGTSKWRSNAYQLEGINNDDEEVTYIEEKDKIKVGIPAKLYLGAKQQFSPKWNYALLLSNTFYSTGSNASATLSLNGHVGSMLSTSVSYTAGYKFNNVGLGLRLRFFPGTDLYFVTDNLLQLFNYENTYRATASFGINISIGTRFLPRQKTSNLES